MTARQAISVLGILSWMKDHQSKTSTPLDEIAAQFDVNPDQMRRNLQWLQGYECVKRGGRGNAEWSITDLGLVRLAEGRFSPSGAFLSPFGHAESFSKVNRNPA